VEQRAELTALVNACVASCAAELHSVNIRSIHLPLTFGTNWMPAAQRLERLNLKFHERLTAVASLASLTALTSLALVGWGHWWTRGAEVFVFPPLTA
jgi:hypothetical protein